MPKRESLRQIALDYIKRKRRWVPAWEIEKVSQEAGYLARTVIRRCQELRGERVLDSKRVDNVAWYRYRV